MADHFREDFMLAADTFGLYNTVEFVTSAAPRQKRIDLLDEEIEKAQAVIRVYQTLKARVESE